MHAQPRRERGPARSISHGDPSARDRRDCGAQTVVSVEKRCGFKCSHCDKDCQGWRSLTAAPPGAAQSALRCKLRLVTNKATIMPTVYPSHTTHERAPALHTSNSACFSNRQAGRLIFSSQNDGKAPSFAPLRDLQFSCRLGPATIHSNARNCRHPCTSSSASFFILLKCSSTAIIMIQTLKAFMAQNRPKTQAWRSAHTKH